MGRGLSLGHRPRLTRSLSWPACFWLLLSGVGSYWRAASAQLFRLAHSALCWWLWLRRCASVVRVSLLLSLASSPVCSCFPLVLRLPRALGTTCVSNTGGEAKTLSLAVNTRERSRSHLLRFLGAPILSACFGTYTCVLSFAARLVRTGANSSTHMGMLLSFFSPSSLSSSSSSFCPLLSSRLSLLLPPAGFTLLCSDSVVHIGLCAVPA